MNTINSAVVLFDGVCNLCNASFKFILKFEKQPLFKFGHLQSTEAQNLLASFPPQRFLDSVILIEDGKLYTASSAALRIAKYLRIFWPMYYLIYLPVWIRDPIYAFVARHRYKWFGRQDECQVPSTELQKRFI